MQTLTLNYVIAELVTCHLASVLALLPVCDARLFRQPINCGLTSPKHHLNGDIFKPTAPENIKGDR